MGAAYSQDLRDRVLAAHDRGMKTGEIAEVFYVSKAWARRVKQLWRESGETTPQSRIVRMSPSVGGHGARPRASGTPAA